jgi:hypothetical protein
MGRRVFAEAVLDVRLDVDDLELPAVVGLESVRVVLVGLNAPGGGQVGSSVQVPLAVATPAPGVLLGRQVRLLPSDLSQPL